MHEPTDGEIRANGVSIGEMDIDEWRDHIAVVEQDPYIFDDTLEYNLTIADRDASWEEVERVCEIAQVDEFLDDLPDGYETQVGDDGVRLSGGQKQRVAIARALLDDVDVLLLDEATSDLDSNLEQDVQAGIETMDREYLVVTVAHRLTTVQNADRIYTLEDGENLGGRGPRRTRRERRGVRRPLRGTEPMRRLHRSITRSYSSSNCGTTVSAR